MMETRLGSASATGRSGDGAIPGTRRIEEIVAPPQPLLRSAPRSAMFFPLVVVAAVLPGLYALNWWDLNPPGPWWGLRGLAVLEGHYIDQTPLAVVGSATEAHAYETVALQPPLYAWLEAISLTLSWDRNPLATVLPSYAAGVLVVMLVYLHGRIWRGRGVGLTAAVLTAFNRFLLGRMQQATPETLGLAGVLAGLLCYAQFLNRGEGRRWPWVLLGGIAFGCVLLSVGLFGLWAIPVIAAHQALLAADAEPRRVKQGWRSLFGATGLWSAAAALAIATAIAAPWYGLMLARHGDAFIAALFAPPQSQWGGATGLGTTLLALAPATLPLSLLAAARGVRLVLAAEPNDPEATGVGFWIVWLAVAALTPAIWTDGPRSTLLLTILIPLNLLAAQGMADLATRRIASRTLIWLAPATALSVAWWLSTDLRDAVADVLAWHRPDAAALLRLHFGIDLIVILAFATRRLDGWARRRDGRRRLILFSFLLGILAITAGSGLREVHFRHQETVELLDLRDAIIRRGRTRPFTLLAVVNPESNANALDPNVQPAGRLRFVLRATLPDLAPLNCQRVEELSSLPNAPGSQRLVLLVGSDQRLPYPLQSQLGLESIYTAGREGILDAFATTFAPQRRTKR